MLVLFFSSDIISLLLKKIDKTSFLVDIRNRNTKKDDIYIAIEKAPEIAKKGI